MCMYVVKILTYYKHIKVLHLRGFMSPQAHYFTPKSAEVPTTGDHRLLIRTGVSIGQKL